ncbi:MAG: DUF167 family protein [Pseudomonadota bacterium]
MVSLTVRLTPSGGADRIDGAARDSAGKLFLKARVRAAPEHGEANAALEKLIAKTLGVPKTKVTVTRGATARLKTLNIEGASDVEIAALYAQFEER